MGTHDFSFARELKANGGAKDEIKAAVATLNTIKGNIEKLVCPGERFGLSLASKLGNRPSVSTAGAQEGRSGRGVQQASL